MIMRIVLLVIVGYSIEIVAEERTAAAPKDVKSQIQMSKDTFDLHEPIVVKEIVANSSQRRVQLSQRIFAVLTVHDDKGKLVPATRSGASMFSTLFSKGPRRKLAARKACIRSYFFNNFFDLSVSGKYTVTVREMWSPEDEDGSAAFTETHALTPKFTFTIRPKIWSGETKETPFPKRFLSRNIVNWPLQASEQDEER